MAVVFISPKQKQKMFLLGITAIFLLFLIIVSVVVFLSEPQRVAPELVFNKPKVDVDIDIFDSEQFKNLQPFEEMKIQFEYTASTKNNKLVTGFVSAVSEEEATEILEARDLKVSDIKEAEIGRDNPFTPYYQEAPPVKTK